MTPQQRTALFSAGAVSLQAAIKLVTGLVTGSLGLLAEAVHSGTDLVAALLTVFAVGVSHRPADVGHPYGHGKAEHLAALGEGLFLVGASLFIVYQSLERLTGGAATVSVPWYALVVLVVIIVIDAVRAGVSLRSARTYKSPALASNAVHFAGDLAGSSAVLIGLLLVLAGYKDADSIAALLVACLVLAAAGRLMHTNVHTLMDRTPDDAEARARRAIAQIKPAVELRRLRMRRAADRHFADVVIGVAASAQVGQGHALADAVESAVEGAVPGSDVVVHVEPDNIDPSVRERALAAALRVPHVREVHNLEVLETDGRTETSLHLKLPTDMALDQAHAISQQVENAIIDSVPEVEAVQTHLEPLATGSEGETLAADQVEAESQTIRTVVRAQTGTDPTEVRFMHTDKGLIAFLTLNLGPRNSLGDAHSLASAIEEQVHTEHPQIAEIVVHTEP
jgi:cation diffusion facilitator family transporter